MASRYILPKVSEFNDQMLEILIKQGATLGARTTTSVSVCSYAEKRLETLALQRLIKLEANHCAELAVVDLQPAVQPMGPPSARHRQGS